MKKKLLSIRLFYRVIFYSIVAIALYSIGSYFYTRTLNRRAVASEMVATQVITALHNADYLLQSPAHYATILTHLGRGESVSPTVRPHYHPLKVHAVRRITVSRVPVYVLDDFFDTDTVSFAAQVGTHAHELYVFLQRGSTDGAGEALKVLLWGEKGQLDTLDLASYTKKRLAWFDAENDQFVDMLSYALPPIYKSVLLERITVSGRRPLSLKGVSVGIAPKDHTHARPLQFTHLLSIDNVPYQWGSRGSVSNIRRHHIAAVGAYATLYIAMNVPQSGVLQGEARFFAPGISLPQKMHWSTDTTVVSPRMPSLKIVKLSGIKADSILFFDLHVATGNCDVLAVTAVAKDVNMHPLPEHCLMTKHGFVLHEDLRTNLAGVMWEVVDDTLGVSCVGSSQSLHAKVVSHLPLKMIFWVYTILSLLFILLKIRNDYRRQVREIVT